MKILFLSLFIAVCAVWADDEEKYLYQEIPDVAISLTNGKNISLRKFCKEQPTIMTLAYSRCAGVCYPFLFHLRDIVPADGEWKNYRVLVLSFDERDTKENISAMASAVDLRGNLRWSFGTIERSRIQHFAQSVGFEFTVDSLSGQINHTPIIVGVNGDGKIVRMMKKFNITRSELWQVYNEIQGGFVPFYKENLQALISCFTYNAEQGKLNVSWGILLLYMPFVGGVAIVWKIFAHQRRDVGVAK